MPVVCAMGAVRDASEEEVCALIEAALSLNMRCVGANLGRTAEFTSKIVTALVAHAKEDRLHRAVWTLPAVETHLRGVGVSKIAPQRTGAWSWDGESNKRSNTGKRKLDDVISGGTEQIVSRTLQHHMHIVAWLHIEVAAVTDDLDRRESMLGLVQLIVTSLWRSRLASEAAHDLHKDSSDSKSTTKTAASEESEQTSTSKVVPVLHLVFKDGRVASLTQSRLAIAMANQHMAAPSEYQVLQMLLALLRDPAVLSTPSSASTTGYRTGDVREVLAHVLPAGLRKSDRKAVRVVELTDTAPVHHTSSRTSFGGKMLNKPSASSVKIESSSKEGSVGMSLACCGYSGQCGCSLGHSAESREVHVVVLLNRVLKHETNTTSSLNSAHQTHLTQGLYNYVYPDKEIQAADSDKVLKKVSSMVYRGALFSSETLISPSIAITVLQHFAYHDRLFAAVDLAINK